MDYHVLFHYEIRLETLGRTVAMTTVLMVMAINSLMELLKTHAIPYVRGVWGGMELAWIIHPRAMT